MPVGVVLNDDLVVLERFSGEVFDVIRNFDFDAWILLKQFFDHGGGLLPVVPGVGFISGKHQYPDRLIVKHCGVCVRDSCERRRDFCMGIVAGLNA